MKSRKPSETFRDLIVWQKAHKLVLAVYRQSRQYPKEEMYALTSQIRRSAMSVAANIVEGFRKKGSADKIRLMNIAQGSLAETEYYLILANDLEYADTELLMTQADEVGRILDSYMKAINEH